MGLSARETLVPNFLHRQGRLTPAGSIVVGWFMAALAACSGSCLPRCDSPPTPAVDAVTAPPPTPVNQRRLGAQLEHEPNNQLPQAEPVVRVPTVIAGALPADDVDCFRLSVIEGAPQVLDLEVTTLQSPRVEVLPMPRPGDDPKKLDTLKLTGGALFGIALSAGEYVVRLSSTEFDGGDYELKLNLRPWHIGAEAEPNNRLPEANPMEQRDAAAGRPTTHRVSGAWSDADDQDCFQLPYQTNDNPSMLRVELRTTPAAPAKLVVHALTPGGPATSDIMARTEVMASNGAYVLPNISERSSESMYVVCAKPTAELEAQVSYVLTADEVVLTQPTELEPNDTPQQPSPLPHQVAVTGYVTPHDVDWYRLSELVGQTTTVSVRAPPGVAVDVALLSADLATLASKQGAPGAAVVIEGAASYVRVKVVSGGEGLLPYTMEAEPK